MLTIGLMFANMTPNNLYAASTEDQLQEQLELAVAETAQPVVTPHGQQFNASAVFATAGVQGIQQLISLFAGRFTAKLILNMLGNEATTIQMTTMKQIIFKDIAFGCNVMYAVMHWISTVLAMKAGVETDKITPGPKIYATALVYGLPLSICAGIASFVETMLHELYINSNKNY